jgi:tetratricopeptide (TPR) repeat protein
MPRRSRSRPVTPDLTARVPPGRVPLAAGALALVCALAYWNSFSAGLILDNIPIVLQDPRLRSAGWQNIRDIFTHGYWWPSGDSNLYRPLTTLTYWLNYTVLGGAEHPAGYHAVNLLLHWANALLAFALVRGVTGRFSAALASAALFACHPLTVESVTNVVGRADLLAGLSVLGGLCLYRGFREAAGGRRWYWVAGLGLAYAAGVHCKESAAVLPALLLLHDLVFAPVPGAVRGAALRQQAARVWPAYAGLLTGAALLAAARWLVLRESAPFAQFGGDNPIVNATFWTGAMTAVKVAGYYLGLVIWPARLACDYSINAITLFGGTITAGQDPHAWLALAALIALAATAVLAWRRQPAVAFFLGFAGIAFLPTANLLFPIGTIMAERLMYLPLVGLLSATVLGAVVAGERLLAGAPHGRRRAWAAGGVLAVVAAIAALTTRTVIRNEDWDSSLSLWSSAARVVPESYKVHKAVALATMESDPSGGRVDEAIALARRSIGIIEQADLPLAQQPAGLYAEAGSYRVRKAQILTGRGLSHEAEAETAAALSLLRRAELIDRELNRLARARLERLGRSPGEIPDVGSAFIYRTLATAYIGAGDPLAAVAAAEYLQRISPGHSDAHYMRGVAEAAAAQFEERRGRPDAVDAHLERAAINIIAATVLNPGHRESWSLLDKVYKYLSPTPPAVVPAESGGRLNRDNPIVARHVQTACAQLLGQLRAAGLAEDAAALRGRMIAQLGVPAALLDAAPTR